MTIITRFRHLDSSSVETVYKKFITMAKGCYTYMSNANDISKKTLFRFGTCVNFSIFLDGIWTSPEGDKRSESGIGLNTIIRTLIIVNITGGILVSTLEVPMQTMYVE